MEVRTGEGGSVGGLADVNQEMKVITKKKLGDRADVYQELKVNIWKNRGSGGIKN